MNAIHPHRGIRAVRANMREADAHKVLADLNSAFDGFKKRHDDRLGTVESNINDVAARLASFGLNGPSTTPNRSLEVEAFGAFCAKGGAGVRDFIARSPSADMSVVVDPEGGYTALPEVDGTIQRRLLDVSPMRRIAEVRTIGAGEYERVLNTGGMASGWVGEKQSRPETAGDTFGAISVPAHEIYAMPAVTQKLLDDSFANVADEVIRSITDEFGLREGASFVTGDGMAKPRGFLSYPTATTADATRALGTLQYVATGTSAGFGTTTNGTDKLIDVIATLRASYRANATWLMNQTTASGVRKLKDSEGRYIWQPAMMVKQPDVLLGYPVVIDENMPTIGADSLSVAFGDFRRGYLIADRIGIRVVRDALTRKGFVLFYTTKRVGGGMMDSEAIKLLKFGTS